MAAVPLVRAQDAPVASAAPREVAADGTVSVVVEPPSTTAAAQDQATPAPAASEAAALLGELLEPFTADPGRTLHERPLPLLEALERSGDRYALVGSVRNGADYMIYIKPLKLGKSAVVEWIRKPMLAQRDQIRADLPDLVGGGLRRGR